MYELFIANKNYSSWSLRPWVLLRQLDIPFDERLVPFLPGSNWEHFRSFSPSGRVPCLHDEGTVVWDSLAIAEYLAESHGGVWPAEREARAWARSAAAEMHSGFAALRERCSMSCGIRVRLHEMPQALLQDVARLSELFREGQLKFGGPFLAGAQFTAVDAFYAPVAFRHQTYALPLGAEADAYLRRMLELRSMREWYAAALAERFRDQPHEEELRGVGVWLQDLRAEPDQ